MSAHVLMKVLPSSSDCHLCGHHFQVPQESQESELNIHVVPQTTNHFLTSRSPGCDVKHMCSSQPASFHATFANMT